MFREIAIFFAAFYFLFIFVFISKKINNENPLKNKNQKKIKP
jgi:hypothetical protein